MDILKQRVESEMAVPTGDLQWRLTQEKKERGRGTQITPKLYGKALRNHISLYLPKIMHYIHMFGSKFIPLELTMFSQETWTNKTPRFRPQKTPLEWLPRITQVTAQTI